MAKSDMKCPRCSWELEHHPKDEIAQWWCKKAGCEFMATEDFMSNLTPEKAKEIHDAVLATKRFRDDQKARKEVEKLEATKIKLEKEQEQKKTVYDVGREYRKIRSLTDFVGNENGN